MEDPNETTETNEPIVDSETQLAEVAEPDPPIVPGKRAKREVRSRVRAFVMPKLKCIINLCAEGGKRGAQIETRKGVMRLAKDLPNLEKFVEQILRMGGKEITKLLSPKTAAELDMAMAELMEYSVVKLEAMIDSEEDLSELRNSPAGKIALINYMLKLKRD